jgi:hypothetical protein
LNFFAGDFEYNHEQVFKASIMLDKIGKQQVKLKTGIYNIAVKVVDNDDLEAIEILKLKINGKIERK